MTYALLPMYFFGASSLAELPKCKSISVFSDGTGVQAVAGGEYLREKYGKKNRRWVQIVILGDPVTKEPISYEVNILPESEPDSAQHQMEELLKAGIDIASFGGDGAFDKMELWNFLQNQGIPPIIKPDKNALDDTDNDIRNKRKRHDQRSKR